jgi:hypothetical protein
VRVSLRFAPTGLGVASLRQGRISSASGRRITPAPVAAKTFVPSTVSAVIARLGSPLFTATQLAPLLVERKTPPPLVPAKTFVPTVATAWTTRFVNPLLTAVQPPQVLSERKTPPPRVPAKIGPQPGEFAASAATFVFVRPVFFAHQATPSVD